MQCLVNMADESELPSQAVTVFAWSSQKHAVVHYPDGRLCVFCWLIPDTFRQMLLLVSLIGSIACWNWSFGFPEKAHNRGLPIPSYPQHHLLWVKTGLWCGWWWFISIAPWSLLFHIIVQYTLFIARHTVLKTKCFIMSK